MILLFKQIDVANCFCCTYNVSDCKGETQQVQTSIIHKCGRFLARFLPKHLWFHVKRPGQLDKNHTLFFSWWLLSTHAFSLCRAITKSTIDFGVISFTYLQNTVIQIESFHLRKIYDLLVSAGRSSMKSITWQVKPIISTLVFITLL